MPDTVLIVDDEDGVRRTFLEWLQAEPGVRVLAAADAETALKYANEEAIDLAVLDWNLGSGSDGLQLLEDLQVFHPELIAILITGFAHQATPLDALRMGVRDYLDKNQDLTREAFLAAVHKQLVRLQPFKRQRLVNESLAQFRHAVDRVVPLVKGTTALNDPTSMAAIARNLISIATRTTGATAGAILVYTSTTSGLALLRAYTTGGVEYTGASIPFERTLAAGAVGRAEPIMATAPISAEDATLYAFEQNHAVIALVTVPLAIGLTVVLEVMGTDGLKLADKSLFASIAGITADFVQKIAADSEAQRMLEAALEAAETATQTLKKSPENEIVHTVKAKAVTLGTKEKTVTLVEAIRDIGKQHGNIALEYCQKMIEELSALLDRTAGIEPPI